jgi:hypothetical protein
MDQAVTLYADLIKAIQSSGTISIRGLATNVANYIPLVEPFLQPSNQSVLSSTFYEYVLSPSATNNLSFKCTWVRKCRYCENRLKQELGLSSKKSLPAIFQAWSRRCCQKCDPLLWCPLHGSEFWLHTRTSAKYHGVAFHGCTYFVLLWRYENTKQPCPSIY